MSSEIIEFRPYYLSRYLVPITVAMDICSFFLIGYSLNNPDWYIFLFLVLAVFSLFLTKQVYDSCKMIVFFEPEGLRVFGDRKCAYRYIPWSKCPYAYSVKTYKGYLFLILSQEPQTKQQLKKLVNYKFGFQLYVERAIVMPFEGQDVSRIEQFLSEKSIHIQAY